MDAINEEKARYGTDALEEQIHLFPPHMTVLIWSTLAKGRALRRPVIKHYVNNVTAEALGPHSNECHPDFIKSLAMVSLNGGLFEGEANDALAGCDEAKYHEHVDTSLYDCEEADYWKDELFHFE